MKMNRKKTDIDQRRHAPLEMIRQVNGGHLDVEKVSELLDVSPVTLRRDLVVLQEQGRISRSYGKVSAVEHSMQSLPTAVSNVHARIAMSAAKHVSEGDIIFLNTSRTALQMLQYIDVPNVTVITNNVLAINAQHRNDLTLILTGGEVRYPKYAMVGDFAQRTLQSMMADKAFLGCSGLSVESGMTTENFAEVSINSLMLSQVKGEVFLLADHTKLSRDSNFISGPVTKISVLITDRSASTELLEQFRLSGVRVEAV